ncbi:MAG: hypothetical protein EXR21_06800 [Flavobacteriaceae bacterium]|nr:hypothetical protein [Flavobacteriaceae bacterium]
MTKFAIRCLLLTAALCSVIYSVSLKKTEWDILPFYGGAAFLCLLSLLVFFISLLGLGKSNSIFMKAFYTGLYMQLFMGICGIMLWLIFSKDKNVPFVLSYMIMFVLYEILVVAHFLKAVKDAKK